MAKNKAAPLACAIYLLANLTSICDAACVDVPRLDTTDKTVKLNLSASLLTKLVSSFQIGTEFTAANKSVLGSAGQNGIDLLPKIIMLATLCQDIYSDKSLSDGRARRAEFLAVYERVMAVTVPSPRSVAPIDDVVTPKTPLETKMFVPSAPISASKLPIPVKPNKPTLQIPESEKITTRELWENKYFLQDSLAHNWVVVVASPNDESLALKKLEELKKKYPKIYFDARPPYNGAPNPYGIIVAEGIAKSEATSLAAWVRELGIAKDAYPWQRPL